MAEALAEKAEKGNSNKVRVHLSPFASLFTSHCELEGNR